MRTRIDKSFVDVGDLVLYTTPQDGVLGAHRQAKVTEVIRNKDRGAIGVRVDGDPDPIGILLVFECWRHEPSPSFAL